MCELHFFVDFEYKLEILGALNSCSTLRNGKCVFLISLRLSYARLIPFSFKPGLSSLVSWTRVPSDTLSISARPNFLTSFIHTSHSLVLLPLIHINPTHLHFPPSIPIAPSNPFEESKVSGDDTIFVKSLPPSHQQPTQ